MKREKLSRTQKTTEKYVIDILQGLKSNNINRALKSTEIYKKVREKYPKYTYKLHTFRVYLSKIVKVDDTKITQKIGGHGYYLSETVISNEEKEKSLIEENTTNEPKINKRGRVAREENLYPIVVDWLRTEGYQVGKEIHNLKIQGSWGNPDVAGIKTNEFLNKHDLEIVTIEVKPSKDKWGNNWRKDIFEAVAHRRFSNRTYFCFARKFGEKIQEIEEMKYYCELYQIGLIILEVSVDMYDKFVKGIKFKIEEGLEEIGVIEKYTAPYNDVPLRYQKEFCQKTLSINSTEALNRFGIKKGRYKS